MRILFAASEIYPLAKTGGLADVAGTLPVALQRNGEDIRLLMPAYRGTADAAGATALANLGDPFDCGEVTLLQGILPGTNLPVLLVDSPALYDRDGGPYQDVHGHDWPDNDLRFAVLGWVAARLGQSGNPAGWQPDIIHLNDWQTGLAAAYLKLWGEVHPGVVFTIHNMAYHGSFPYSLVPRLGFPWSFFTPDGFEFWDHLSYLKAGLVYSDKLTTVSPTYSHEIQTPSYGFGMDGLLAWRNADLVGILNGVDYDVWDPASDHYLPHTYNAEDFVIGKAANKAALQNELNLPQYPDVPLLIVVSRLSPQKGMDLLLSAMPVILAQGAQLALLGSGEKRLEEAFQALADTQPQQVATRLGYSEELAHRLQAGGDMLLMPSRFEPCGLTQIYALRYGTLPVVHGTGGLADTVVDASYDSLLHGTATGFVFDHANVSAFEWCIERAISFYRQPDQWCRIQQRAIEERFDWDDAAQHYQSLYRGILQI